MIHSPECASPLSITPKEKSEKRKLTDVPNSEIVAAIDMLVDLCLVLYAGTEKEPLLKNYDPTLLSRKSLETIFKYYQLYLEEDWQLLKDSVSQLGKSYDDEKSLLERMTFDRAMEDVIFRLYSLLMGVNGSNKGNSAALMPEPSTEKSPLAFQ